MARNVELASEIITMLNRVTWSRFTTQKRSLERYSDNLNMSRAEKIGDLFRDEIAAIIQKKLRDPRLAKIISVNEVSVAKDLAYADVYVSSFETQSEEEKQELILS